jgi:putative copper resistance protein D
VLLVLRVSTASLRRRFIVPILRSSAVGVLTNPIITAALFVVVLMGTHFSPFYDVALTHRWVHDYVEHPLYLLSALLLYYPLIGTNPAPRTLSAGVRLLILALMMVPEAITGFFIYASPYVMYPYYAGVARPFGPSPLTDQQLGGSLMWSAGMLLDTAWVALAARDWLRADARRTRRLDLLAAREASVARIRFL